MSTVDAVASPTAPVREMGEGGAVPASRLPDEQRALDMSLWLFRAPASLGRIFPSIAPPLLLLLNERMRVEQCPAEEDRQHH
jgi:hypothetical protein